MALIAIRLRVKVSAGESVVQSCGARDTGCSVAAVRCVYVRVTRRGGNKIGTDTVGRGGVVVEGWLTYSISYSLAIKHNRPWLH